MTKQSPKVVFFGNERLATGVTTTAPTLQALIAAGYEVVAVVVNNETAVSRVSRQLEIVEVAEKHNIPVLSPSKLLDIRGELESYGADVGVLVAYGKIVPQDIIGVFPFGIVNIHPSKLPTHRGPTPIESVLLSGEVETAVSLMKLVKAMDAGPVYVQRTYSVPAKISKQELADELLKIGSKLLVQTLPSILDSSLSPLSQDELNATYDSLLSKDDGAVDWTKPAETLEREVRAFYNWPKSIAKVGDHTLIIREADVVNTSGKPGDYTATKKELLVYCGKDAFKILKVQPLNKKEMPIEAFLAGRTL